jgi:hypothetical protein
MPGATKKYGKFIIREPLYKGTFAPILHICGESHRCGDRICAGAAFEHFPVEHTVMCISKPLEMRAQTHAHDYDQLLYFLGSDPTNLFDFEAEIEIRLGQEAEVHNINTTSIVYLPRGMLHCPIKFIKIGKPIIFMHLSIASEYARSKGETDSHPRSYEVYSAVEIDRYRKR